MSVSEPEAISLFSVEDCQRLAPPIRRDLEVLDYEIRRLLARARADAQSSGSDDAIFLQASSTVMLSIAADVMARAAEERRQRLDAGSFLDAAESALSWARNRRLRYLIAGEA